MGWEGSTYGKKRNAYRFWCGNLSKETTWKGQGQVRIILKWKLNKYESRA